MPAVTQLTTETLAGQPAVALTLPQGDRVLVTLHGGQVVSWQSADEAGRLTERLYLSPRAVFDGSAAIRGGVPVCWPQFNRRGPLVKHGFLRNLPWQPVPTEAPDTLVLRLASSEASRVFWPERFEATLTVRLAPASLHMALDILNTGDTPWSFTGALHTYLHVQDAAAASLHGLQGAARWDAVHDARSTEASPALRFGEEFDSVFATPAAPLLLHDGARRLQISQSASCTETVVWNPGPALCATLPDMPGDGWRHMLCVEAACIDMPQLLPPGAHWQAWQALRALA